MSLDPKILHRARTRLDESRRAREGEYLRRQNEIYALNPAVRETDMAIKASMSEVIGLALARGENPASAIDSIKEENLALQMKRAEQLSAMGRPIDYLDEKYACLKCHDTGYNGTKLCSCLLELYKDEQQKDLSSVLKLGAETFDLFDLDYYDDIPLPPANISPRRNMDIIYEICINFAEKFGRDVDNLFLTGGTGLGKTFLSTCIAKVVSDRGFSVVYDTAVSLFGKFEEDKFFKNPENSALSAELRRYMSCDLLIIDDLGTEMTTAFVVSALYNLINTRLTTGKKTVINSNLSIEEIRRRYSQQIASRLEGEYLMLPFFGRDIRLIKRERM